MKYFTILAITLLALTSCQKEAIVETATTDNQTKVLVSFSSKDAVVNFVNGKWSWKETVIKQRIGLVYTTPANSGIQKVVQLTGNTATVFENGKMTMTENFELTHTDAGWLFEGAGCSGILYHLGEQLIIAGSFMDKADNYFERTK